MKNILAGIFRLLFRIPLFRNKYFGFHKHLFHPYHFFSKVKKQIIYRENIKLNISLDDWIQQQIYFLGDYEKPEIDYLYETLKSGDIFVDIGANIGLFSLNASNIVGESGHVFGFEAYGSNHGQFEANIDVNNFQNITAEKIAISDKKNFIDILYHDKDKNIGMASAYLKDYTSKESVKCVSLDSYFADNKVDKVDLVKIDIEGGEYDALLGMSKIMSELKPKILIEINKETLDNSNHSEEELLHLLKNYNYKLLKKLSISSQAYNAVFEFSVEE